MTTARQGIRRWVASLGLMVALVALSGCYEDPTDVHLYDPGVYKGASDPLLAKSGTESFTEALRERFEAGQTDR